MISDFISEYISVVSKIAAKIPERIFGGNRKMGFGVQNIQFAVWNENKALPRYKKLSLR
jgi:hypothetical protein